MPVSLKLTYSGKKASPFPTQTNTVFVLTVRIFCQKIVFLVAGVRGDRTPFYLSAVWGFWAWFGRLYRFCPAVSRVFSTCPIAVLAPRLGAPPPRVGADSCSSPRRQEQAL